MTHVSPASANFETFSTKNILDVERKINLLLSTYKSKDILVAFDVDMTLTQPDHPATYYPALKKHYDLYKKILKKLPPGQRDYATFLTTQIDPQRFVEEKTLQTIRSIRKSGVKLICLTASLAGKSEDASNRHIIKRWALLKKMGIDFSSSFPESTEAIVFSDIPKHGGGHPVFYQGVLSSNGEYNPGVNKGTVLVAFLEHMGARTGTPKVIVLVDDRKKNIEDIREVLKSHYPEVHFIGIEYHGALTYAPQDISAQDFETFWSGCATLAQKQEAH